MYAIDDGLTSGNFNAADIFWLIGLIVAVVAAILYAVTPHPVVKWAPVALSAAVACVAFGLFLL